MFVQRRAALSIGYTLVALLAICVAWLMINLDLLQRLITAVSRQLSFQVVADPVLPRVLELLLFGFIINFLIYGGAVFTLTRLGYLRRQRRHRPMSADQLMTFYDSNALPTLTVLIPSYKEEPEVVRRTLMSAALLEYPGHNVTLLIDDPPHPKSSQDRASLAAIRRLPGEVAELLEIQARKLNHALRAFETRVSAGAVDVVTEQRKLARLYDHVAVWYLAQAAAYPVQNHEDAFYVEHILLGPARAHRRTAQQLRHKKRAGGEMDEVDALHREYRRLAGLFTAKITSFERKQFENLSHEANKAMNLNSYIGLMGGEWRSIRHGNHNYLQAARHGQGNLVVAEPDYVITLDADSLLLHEYALHLIYEMEKTERQRTAIIQTPYSAFPGAPTALEYIAGAQTDMQYIVHQGFTAHEATFWVGANALLRKVALDEIAEQLRERGHLVTRYIQDRTVIEDTESSIDLIERGWELFNYPARMAFSATPPDFGSLMIQRRRWANGGLIIYPKLLRHLWSGPDRARKLPEGFLRAHYLISTAFTNLGLLLLILLSLDTALLGPWLIMAVLAYFLIYAESLKEFGYRRRDLFRVWALNLLLIPVNLAGAYNSLQQAATGQRVPFSRTPKVGHRTATPAWLILFLAGLGIVCAFSALYELVRNGMSFDVAFAALNSMAIFYGITEFIEWQNAWEDIQLVLPRVAKGNQEGLPIPNANGRG